MAGIKRFFQEVGRRRVFQVLGAYAVVAWLIIQAAGAILPLAGAPAWVGKAVLVVLVLALPVIIPLSWVFDLTPTGLKRTAAAPDNPARPSVAVLPFENLSADPENEYFSDGITEDIITRLSKISALKVISRTSSMRFRGTRQSICEVGAALGVANILEGSVRRSGERLRVTAQLIDATSDEHIWAETYDRRITDVFAVQAELAEAIAGALNARFTPAEAARVRQHLGIDPETYNLCLLGRHAWHRWTESDLQSSISHFKLALERDAECALAHYGLGLSYGTLALGYWSVRGRDFYPLAKQSLQRAIELDPELAEALAWLATFEAQHEYDWGGAEARIDRALQLAPNSATVHDQHHLVLIATGRFAEGTRESLRAVDLDPLSYFILANAALCAYRTRDYERSVALFRRGMALDPNLPMAHALMALPLAQLGRHDEAVACVRRALGTGLNAVEAFVAMISARSGNFDEARASLARIEARRTSEHVWPFSLAMAYATVGDTDAAFRWLDEAYEERDFWMTWLAVEPTLDSLRSDPRFDVLLDLTNLSRFMSVA